MIHLLELWLMVALVAMAWWPCCCDGGTPMCGGCCEPDSFDLTIPAGFFTDWFCDECDELDDATYNLTAAALPLPLTGTGHPNITCHGWGYFSEWSDDCLCPATDPKNGYSLFVSLEHDEENEQCRLWAQVAIYTETGGSLECTGFSWHWFRYVSDWQDQEQCNTWTCDFESTGVGNVSSSVFSACNVDTTKSLAVDAVFNP